MYRTAELVGPLNVLRTTTTISTPARYYNFQHKMRPMILLPFTYTILKLKLAKSHISNFLSTEFKK
ncbi:hypothetical protein QTP88_012536 [Uroleucon formosanum]